MGEIDSCELHINMFNSIKNQTKEESNLLTEKSPLFLQQKAPKDWFKLTYIILFLHGIGHLLPWNMFITAHDYFYKRFKCPEHSNSSLNQHCHGFEDSFENYFSIAAMASVAATSAVNIYIQSKVHFKYRMFTSLTIMFLLFVFTTIMVKVPTQNWVDGFFAVSVLTIILMNLFSGLFQSSTFGFAGILPQEYTAAVMAGQAWAGLFSSIVRIITTVAVPSKEDYRWSALFYFLSAALVTFICFVSFFLLMTLNFVKFHMEQTSVRAIKEKQESATVNVVEANPRLLFFAIFRRMQYKVFIVGIGSGRFSINVADSKEEFLKTTVLELKEKIHKVKGEVDPEHMRLLFASKQLEDEKAFIDYNIQNNSTIIVVTRVIGGGGCSKIDVTINISPDARVHNHTIREPNALRVEPIQSHVKDKDVRHLKLIVEDVMTGNEDRLTHTLKDIMDDFATKLLSKDLIARATKDNLTYSKFINQFFASLEYKDDVKSVEVHCSTLLEVLTDLGGPARNASRFLRRQLIQKVQDELHADLHLN